MKIYYSKTVLSLILSGILLFISAPNSHAGAVLSGFNTNTFDGGQTVTIGGSSVFVHGNDDGSTGLVSLGFSINYYGKTRSSLYINNNGNVTFDSALFTFTPFDLTTTSREILAPYFGDVDTRGTGSALVTYGTGTVNGHAAFGVNWPGVGYFSQSFNKLNIFQLVIIDRSDTGAGNWDFEFNYNQVQWETGGASGGSNGLGGKSARAGFSLGNISVVGSSFELGGSAINGDLLDSGPNATSLIRNHLYSTVPGQYTFSVRNDSVILPPPSTWVGAVDNRWTSYNWTVDAASGMRLPSGSSDVIFATTSVNNLNTVLGADTLIKSLTIQSPGAVTISGTNSLSILGTLGTTGINVDAGAGLFTINAPLVLQGASQTITVNNAAGAIFNGPVDGTIGLEKAGVGVLVLTGSNTYTGSTLVDEGVLQIGNGTSGSIQATGTGALATSGSIIVAASGTFALNLANNGVFTNKIANDGIVMTVGPNTNTLSSNISGSGGFVQNGTGITILTGLNTYLGATIVASGTLQLTGTAGSISSATDFSIFQGGALILDSGTATVWSKPIANDGTVVFVQSALGSYTLSGVISGSGSLIKSGTNNVAITTAQTFTGAMLIAGGTVSVSGDNMLASSASLQVNAGATFDLGNYSQALGSLVGAGSVLTGSSTVLSVGSNDSNATFSGVISGGATLQKVGQGTLTLTGVNTYTGPTFVNAGGLEILGSIQNSGTVTIGASGTLAINMANGAVFNSQIINDGVVNAKSANTNYISSPISGQGSFYQSGQGTTVLTGSNTYAGSTTVVSGTLKIGDGSTGTVSGSSAISVHSGGMLILDSPDSSLFTHSISNDGAVVLQESAFNSYTYSGSITGTGALGKSGTNTLILSGSNSYTGMTRVMSGTLVIGSANALPANSELEVINGASLDISGVSQSLGSLYGDSTTIVITGSNTVTTVGSDNSNATFGGNISGFGDIHKVGSGIWNLTGANTCTGMTSINGGGLLVNGSLQGDVSVLAGFLGGSGIIHGNVLNQALVSPGNSPGTLTIGGNYTQSASGTLLVEIASATVYDKLVVGGTAQIDGRLQVSLLGKYRVKAGQHFSIVTADQGVNGTFVDTSSLAQAKLSLVYEPNSIVLESIYHTFANTPGMTPNERAVASGIDKMMATDEFYSDNKLLGIADYLTFLPSTSLPGALERIVPTDYVILPDASFALAQVQVSNLERRMEEIRSTLVDYTADVSAPSTFFSNSASARTQGVRYISQDGRELTPEPIERHLGFFLNGSGEAVTDKSSLIDGNSKFDTSGISAGADYRFNDNFAAGLTAGYGNTTTTGRGNGSVGIDSGNLSAYGTLFNKEGFFVNGILGAGSSNYDIRRESLCGTAHATASGLNFQALLGGGYTYYSGAFSAGPIASLRYCAVQIDGFSESGSLTPLDISKQDKSSFKSTLGFQIAYEIPADSVIIKPQAKLQWRHEYSNDSRDIDASFQGSAGGAFTVWGPALGSDSMLLDLGVTVQVTPAVAFYTFYSGDIGSSSYTSNSVFGGVQLSF